MPRLRLPTDRVPGRALHSALDRRLPPRSTPTSSSLRAWRPCERPRQDEGPWLSRSDQPACIQSYYIRPYASTGVVLVPDPALLALSRSSPGHMEMICPRSEPFVVRQLRAGRPCSEFASLAPEPASVTCAARARSRALRPTRCVTAQRGSSALRPQCGHPLAVLERRRTRPATCTADRRYSKKRLCGSELQQVHISRILRSSSVRSRSHADRIWSPPSLLVKMRQRLERPRLEPLRVAAPARVVPAHGH
jgi:hypothetical protein